jgi:hypothetical protein
VRAQLGRRRGSLTRTRRPKKVGILSQFSTLDGAATFPHGTKNSPVLKAIGPRLQRFTLEKLQLWAFEWAAWGAALGLLGLYFVSLIPRVPSLTGCTGTLR